MYVFAPGFEGPVRVYLDTYLVAIDMVKSSVLRTPVVIITDAHY